MILDTTFLIDLIKNNHTAILKARELFGRGETLYITAISVFELWQGTEDFQNKEKRERIFQLLERLEHFDFDVQSAKIGGEIRRGLMGIGQAVEVRDIMIAGIAINKGETVLTRNIKDFSKIVELRIESY